jgi:hypothetical protein
MLRQGMELDYQFNHPPLQSPHSEDSDDIEYTQVERSQSSKRHRAQSSTMSSGPSLKAIGN